MQQLLTPPVHSETIADCLTSSDRLFLKMKEDESQVHSELVEEFLTLMRVNYAGVKRSLITSAFHSVINHVYDIQAGNQKTKSNSSN